MDSAAALGQIVGPLRRALIRATRLAAQLPDLPEAQIELLRALSTARSATPGELAAALRLSPSTVSNLVRTMTAPGLLDRSPSTDDLRVVVLSATPAGERLLERYTDASNAALEVALSAVSAEDRAALEAAAPALRRLVRALHEQPPATNTPA